MRRKKAPVPTDHPDLDSPISGGPRDKFESLLERLLEMHRRGAEVRLDAVVRTSTDFGDADKVRFRHRENVRRRGKNKTEVVYDL